MSRITISKPSLPSLEVRSAPFRAATRWLSPYETTEPRIWPNIFMTQTAYREVNLHAASQPDLEVGGMLIGGMYLTPEKELVVAVEAQIEAQHVVNSAMHLTFTSKTFASALDRIDKEYPDKQIVGWYHTHPALSVFLSSMDVWLHSHFFPQAWHVALVVDPYVNHGGFFYYPSGVTDYVHPKHYAGFYELREPGAASTVDWYNLTQHKVSGEAVSVREDQRYES